jgi:hypothetical protein
MSPKKHDKKDSMYGTDNVESFCDNLDNAYTK